MVFTVRQELKQLVESGPFGTPRWITITRACELKGSGKWAKYPKVSRNLLKQYLKLSSLPKSTARWHSPIHKDPISALERSNGILTPTKFEKIGPFWKYWSAFPACWLGPKLTWTNWKLSSSRKFHDSEVLTKLRTLNKLKPASRDGMQRTIVQTLLELLPASDLRHYDASLMERKVSGEWKTMIFLGIYKGATKQRNHRRCVKRALCAKRWSESSESRYASN